MRKSVAAFLLSCAATHANAGDTVLAGVELQSAVSGKTVYVQSPLGEIPIRYHANGTLHGATELAVFDGESQTADSGKWWVKETSLCMQWHNWMHGRPHCFTMHKLRGTMVAWRRDDGKSGTARLSRS